MKSVRERIDGPIRPTPQQMRKLELAVRIAQSTPKERDAIGFSARLFALASLPHTDPGELREWTRKNGDALLSVVPGSCLAPDGSIVSLGLPYGPMPRLLLIYLASKAARSGSRRIDLGENLVDLFDDLRIPCEGRRIAMLQKQAERLFAASMRYSFRTSVLGAGGNAGFAEKYVLWGAGCRGQEGRLPSHVILNAEFYEEIAAHRFPVDLDALSGLRQSSMALDLYVWLAFRLSRLDHAVRIRYDDIALHVGADYSDPREFARECRTALDRVLFFWSALDCEPVHGGLRLAPCPLAVARL